MNVAPHGYADIPAERRATRARLRRTAAARGAHRVLVALALVGSLHALFLLGVEAWRFVQEERALVRLQHQVTGLQSESGELKQVIDHADDRTYREDLARQQGYMYPDELRAVTQEPPAAEPAGSATPGGR